MLLRSSTLAAALFILTAAPAFARGLDEIRERGRLDIGLALFTPWAMVRDDGILTGFEVEVGAGVALDMGVKPAFHLHDWDELIPALESRRIDVVIAGMTVTPKRSQRVAFSLPYAEGEIGVAVNTRQVGRIDTLGELDKTGLRVGVVRKTVAEQAARRSLSQALRVPFFDSRRLLDALLDGEVGAYIGEQPGPRFAALLHPGEIETPIAQPLLSTREAMAVHKGDLELLAYLNRWIKQNRDQGWLDEVRNHWFGSLGWHRRE